jgi:hypothetical protein
VHELVHEQGAYQRVLLTSSAAVYGEPRSLPVDEEAEPSPVSPWPGVQELAAAFARLGERLVAGDEFHYHPGEVSDEDSPLPAGAAVALGPRSVGASVGRGDKRRFRPLKGSLNEMPGGDTPSPWTGACGASG